MATKAATTEKSNGKGYTAPRLEPVNTEMGYALKPLRGKEVKEIKRILTKNFEAVQRAMSKAEADRVERLADLPAGTELPPDQGVGMAVAEVVLDEAFDDVWDFLGEVVDKDLDDLPWIAHIDILEALVKYDDFPTYVSRLWNLGRTFQSVISTDASSDTESPNGS